MKRLILLLVFPMLAFAGPSAEDLDYSFSRPLLVESKFVNGFRFDIIRPKDRFAILEDVPYMADMYGDNFLIVVGLSNQIVEARQTEGWFSFEIMDDMDEKFGGTEEGLCDCV